MPSPQMTAVKPHFEALYNELQSVVSGAQPASSPNDVATLAANLRSQIALQWPGNIVQTTEINRDVSRMQAVGLAYIAGGTGTSVINSNQLPDAIDRFAASVWFAAQALDNNAFV